MKKLTHQQYCDYYADKCNRCKGDKRLHVDGMWVSCPCQRIADLKYRFDKFEISPANLKYKKWDDFDGFGRLVDGKKQQALTHQSLIESKSKALKYCFGTDDRSCLDNRKLHLRVHKHIEDGQNVIIVGEKQSGRTLLAALIIKEVAYACKLFSKNISFQCVKSYELHNYARWDDAGKRIDHAVLYDLADVDFLVIDQIEMRPPRGHHTNPADIHSLEMLFGTRRTSNHPTILICSCNFWAHFQKYSHDIAVQWGNEFVSIMSDSNNVIIELEKEIIDG